MAKPIFEPMRPPWLLMNWWRFCHPNILV
jgi:hypothetical protein